MTAAEHPPIEQIADLQAGLLPADQAAEVSAHLADCSACTDVGERLTDVSGLLAEAGRQPVTMPDQVANSIEAAINRASAERAAGVPSLADRRTSEGTPTTPTHRRWAPLLLGAAATVVALAAGGAVLHNGLTGSGDSQSDSAAGGSSGDNARPGDAENQLGGSESDESGGASADPVPTLTKDKVVPFAREFATSPSAARVPRNCHARTTADALAADQNAYVVFQGRPAVLSLDELARTVTVVACSDETRLLFRSGY